MVDRTRYLFSPEPPERPDGASAADIVTTALACALRLEAEAERLRQEIVSAEDAAALLARRRAVLTEIRTLRDAVAPHVRRMKRDALRPL